MNMKKDCQKSRRKNLDVKTDDGNCQEKRSQRSERQRYQGGSLQKISESGQKRQEQYQKHENNHGKTKKFSPKFSKLRRRYQPGTGMLKDSTSMLKLEIFKPVLEKAKKQETLIGGKNQFPKEVSMCFIDIERPLILLTILRYGIFSEKWEFQNNSFSS